MLRVLLLLVFAGAVPAQGRVVVIGVDGLDHAITRELLEQGALPELSRLAAEGTFAPLLPTNPAQSPTSWASLTSGLGPGRTGIFGFLRRSLEGGEVRPEIALATVEMRPLLSGGMRALAFALAALVAAFPLLVFRRRRRAGLLVSLALLAFLLLSLRWFFAQIPSSLPVPRNARSGDALWEALDREGVSVTSLFAPCAFPAPEIEHGHLLCGLGVPDLLGTHGTTTVFRNEPVPDDRRVTPMGGRVIPLEPAEDGSLGGAAVLGPRDPLDPDERLEAPLRLVPEGDALALELDEQRVVLEPGRFSDFLAVRFPMGEVAPPLSGLVRFRLLRAEPALALYQEPLQFDPRRQVRWAPITAPPEYGAELARSGLFETLGWATATNPYQDELIDDATLVDDVRGQVERQHAMVLEELDRPGWRLHFSVLATPDRVQHMFWRDRDPEHPAHDPVAAAARGDLIREAYVAIDALVGRIRKEALKPDDVLLVVSDHGFAPFHHAVNVNRWLAESGYLVASPEGARTLERDLGSPIRHVDWSKTRAYSLGLGRIWLNLEGREPAGIVPAGEARALEDEIAAGLLALRHEGRPVVRSVRSARELYRGGRVSESADLVIGFERGYRVSWSSCLLGLDEPVIFPNRTRWSGDHCSVDPALVPGVLFATRKLDVDPDAGVAPSVLDVYPTVRALLGLEPVPDLDGRSLLGRTE